MGKQSANWKEIKNWIESNREIASFYCAAILEKLDKASCLRILKDHMFACYYNESYNNQHPYYIKELPENLKSDSEIAILAIERDSYNFDEISDSLRTSVDFHKELINNQDIDYELIFSESPSTITDNKDFVYLIISDFPSIYSALSEDLRLDKEILNKVLKKKVFPEKIPNDFSNDKKIILKLIEAFPNRDIKGSNRYKYDNEWLLSFISKELLTDRDILKKLFDYTTISIEVPETLKSDKELILSAVKSNPSYYESIDNYLKTNREIVVEAFKGDANLFLKYSDNNDIDCDTILEYIKSIKLPNKLPLRRRFFDEKDPYQEFEEVVEKLVKNGMFVNEIALHLIFIWPLNVKFYKYFQTLSPDLKKNKNVISKLLRYAISRNLRMIDIDSQESKVTVQFVFENFILPNQSDNRDLILQTIKFEPSLYPKIPDKFKSDEEIILSAIRLKSVERRDEFLKTLPNNYFNNKSLILKFLKTHLSSDFDDCLFKYASVSLRDDDSFVKEAIKIQPQSISHSSDRLKNDIKYQRLAFSSFKRVREAMRVRFENSKDFRGLKKRNNFHKPPFFCNNKTDDFLDFEFLEKHCKKLLNNKEFTKKNNIKKTPFEPNYPWREWEAIKNHFRKEFQQTEVYNDENENIIIFKKKDTFFIIGYLYSEASNILGVQADGITDFIDFIKSLGNRNYKPFKVYLLCNFHLSKISTPSDILTLPNDVDYYYVNYNRFSETIEFKLENLNKANKHSSSIKQINTPWYKKMGIQVITDNKFENWDKWSNNGYHREWYAFNSDKDEFEDSYFSMYLAVAESYIDERLLGFYFVWKWNSKK